MGSIEQILCHNEPCTNIVERKIGRTPGMPKKYCCFRCGQQQRSREYYRRQTTEGSVDVDRPAFPHVIRVMPRTATKADELRLKHLDHCSQARPEDLGRCPARFDPYCAERTCLMYAVMCDDWDHLRRLEKFGDPGERRNTTADGYWHDQRPPTREEQQEKIDAFNAQHSRPSYPERVAP